SSQRGKTPLKDGYDADDPLKKWGPGGGIYKPTDGGKSWKKLATGLPASPTGRIGVSWYRKDPNVLYAIIDCQKIGMGTPPSRLWLGVQGENAENGAKLTAITPESPAAKASLKANDVVTTADGQPVKDYAALTNLLRGHKEGDNLALQVLRDGKTVDMAVTLEERPLGSYGQGRPSMAALLGAFGDDTADGIKIARVFE